MTSDRTISRLATAGKIVSIGFVVTAVHMLEEQRPIETAWDVVTAASAYAKSVGWQDQRVKIERAAGEILTKNTVCARWHIAGL